jgi:hypothetical protein
MVTQVHEGERQRTQARCPQCPRVLPVHEHVGRTVETMVGPVALQRPSFYCRACRVGFAPLDDALGSVAGCKQLDMQQAAAQSVPAVPNETAQALFGALTDRWPGRNKLA